MDRKFELPGADAPGHSRGRGGGRGRGAARKPKPQTPEEQEAMLKGYVRLDRSRWSTLKAGDQIRYLSTDGQLKSSGIITKVRFKGRSSGGEPPELMELRPVSGFFKPWVVGWKSFVEIYLKPSPVMGVMQERTEAALKALEGNDAKIANVVRAIRDDNRRLEARVAALEAKVRTLEGH